MLGSLTLLWALPNAACMIPMDWGKYMDMLGVKFLVA